MPKEKSTVLVAAAPPQQQQNFREKRRWEGDRAPSENKRPQFALKPPQNGGRQTAPNQMVEYRPRAPPCAKCSKNHHGKCKVGTNKCFNCGKGGHFSRECPDRNAGVRGRQNYQGQRPQLRALQAEPRGKAVLPSAPQPKRQLQQRLPTQARAFALRQKQPKTEPGNQEQGNLAG
ncbi:uncharacterized protein LOC125205562 isoform X2 [Salvia hispanica]|nr:uncharacterized protein LOC125205562 isoform X2 [Salvia hispanica]